MTAGLPNRARILLCLVLVLLVAACCGVSQEVQTPSMTLQPIIDTLALNPIATAEQQQQLTNLFETALDAGLMLQDQGLAMIALVNWLSLETEEQVADAIALLEDVLESLIAESIADPVAELGARLLLLEQQPVFDAIGANLLATAEQTQLLIDQLTEAFAVSLLTPAQALEMLGFVHWESIEAPEDLEEAISLLTDTLSSLLAGEIVDPLAALTSAYNAAMTPDGITNATSKSGVSDETLAAAQEIVASGLPPGIVLRVTKQALLDGKDPAEVLAILAEAYGDPSDPVSSPGQAANEATDRGSYRYEEQEEEQNTNEGDTDGAEVEKNANGPKDTGKAKDHKKK